MAGKKATFTCKICGQEHAGLICTKFSSVRVFDAKNGRTFGKIPEKVGRKLPAVPQLTAPAKPIDRVSTPALPEIDGEATDVTISIDPATPDAPIHVTKSPGRTGRPKTGAKTAAQRKADSRAKAKAARA